MLGEGGQDTGEHVVVPDKTGPEPDHPPGFIDQLRKGFPELLFLVRYRRSETEQGPSCLGERQPGLPVEQGRAAVFFQTGNVVGQGLLGQEQPVGSTGHVQVLGQFPEVCFVPYMKLQIYSASIQIFTAIIQPVADRRIIESLNCLCKGIRLLIRVVISSGFLFVISIAIICMTTNVKT